MTYKKPSYLGAFEEEYRMTQSMDKRNLEQAYENLKRDYKKLKNNQVAPYCNS